MTTLETRAATPTLTTPRENRLPESLQLLDDAVFIIDLHSSRVIDANDSAKTLFDSPMIGLSRSDLESMLSGCRCNESGTITSKLSTARGTRDIELHIGQPDTDGRIALIAFDLDESKGIVDSRHVAIRTRALMEERERFARDLHDGVTQEVIAASMNLAALIPLASDELRDRIEAIIDRQEAILHNLRMTVFGLKETSRRRIDAIKVFTQTIHDGSSTFPKRPNVSIDGSVADLDDPVFLGSAVLGLREMLSNVSRHARATEVTVTIRVLDAHLEIVVHDDGIGFDPEAPRGNGLSNLDARARGAGGRFSIGRHDDRNTRAEFRIPCPEATA